MKRRNIQQEILDHLRNGDDYKNSMSQKLGLDFTSISRAVNSLFTKGKVEISREENKKIFYKIKE